MNLFTVPSEVKIIGVVGVSNSILNVIWIPPVHSNGLINNYEVIYSVYDDTINVITYEVAGDKNSFAVSNLGKLCLSTDQYVVYCIILLGIVSERKFHES